MHEKYHLTHLGNQSLRWYYFKKTPHQTQSKVRVHTTKPACCKARMVAGNPPSKAMGETEDSAETSI